ncbi:MAG: FAD-dependent oxidoreductase [Anaerolineales bacterium]
MKKYTYLIIGGGMAAASAVKGIREVDSGGSIGLFSKESVPPYNRPPLSKGLWDEDGPDKEDIWREMDAIHNLDMYLDTAIVEINREEQLVFDEQSNQFHYEKLLLATGGDPTTLPFDEEGEHILYFRTLKDFERLYAESQEKDTFGVIGGGFIGAEIAASLREKNRKVVMLFPEHAIGSLRYPEQVAELITNEFKRKGIQVLGGEMVNNVIPTEDRYTITTQSGKSMVVDQVIAGIGISPNLSLAESIGLEVEDGIIVDKTLRTSDINIWAAGDVASFYSPHLEERIRVEHAENAKQMGRLAGKNMAGETEPYNILPLFYSDMFDMGYEAVGELNPEMKVIIDWKKKPEKGVVYYLDEAKGSVRGVILWNIWGKVDQARDLIASEEQFKPVDLVNRI